MGRTVGSRLRFKAWTKVENRLHDWPSGGGRCRGMPYTGGCICRKGCRCRRSRGRCHRCDTIDQLMVVVVMDVVQRLKSLRLQRGCLQRNRGAGLLNRQDRRGSGPATVGGRCRRNLDRSSSRGHHGNCGRGRRCHRNSTSSTGHLSRTPAAAFGTAGGSAEDRRRWQGKLMKMLWLMMLLLLLLLLWHGG
uniref:(northern house mosquito) hypothetical protein n=1 Tax=Culex pipiens TaxID=7175 RepID=A0A8D8AL42_CULPI